MSVRSRVLLLGGAIAGPLFTLAWILGGSARTDYSPLRHPVSSLALGELGWIQSTTFVVTGLLLMGFAFGLRRVLPRATSKWGPIFIGAMGLGLLGAGLFVTDPMNGYPPGTPALPLTFSLEGRLHRLFSALFFLGLPLACLNFSRVFARWDNRIWTVYSACTGAAFLATFLLGSAGFAQAGGLASLAGSFQRLALTIGWTWLTLLAIHVVRRDRDRRRPGRGLTNPSGQGTNIPA